jgi:hypothetical protein
MPVSARTLNVACNGFLQAIMAWLDGLNHLSSNVKLDNDRRVQQICTKRYLTVDIRVSVYLYSYTLDDIITIVYYHRISEP